MSYAKEIEVGQTFARKVSRENVIRFDALECQLYGRVGGVKFGPWSAVSGAGLNTHRKLQGTKLAAWLPSKRTTGKAPAERGGVIPPGWWIALPEVLSAGQTSMHIGKGGAPTDASIKLVPVELACQDPNTIGNCIRGGFYIHGASKDSTKLGAGSDGCILLAPQERKWLATKVLDAGGAWLYVFVNGVKIDRMIELQIARSNMA